MEIIEITVAEWNKLNLQQNTYFINGCLFDEVTDNLIAFARYRSGTQRPDKYFKVEEIKEDA